jgi:hypothetical protein
MIKRKLFKLYYRVCRATRRYWKLVFGVCLSLFLLVGSLYQLEIVHWCISTGKQTFDWPFYMFPSVNIWVARDIFYLGLVASWIILFATLWFTE